MTEKVDPIEAAVLARLIVKSKKPPTRSEVMKSVAALFGSAAGLTPRIEAVLEQLEVSGMRKSGSMLLTDKGKKHALSTLELNARDIPTRWSAVKALLTELAVGRGGRGRAMTASALRAAALAAKLNLPGETSSPSEVLDAWAARELGMGGKRLTIANVRAYALSKALGIEVRDPKRIGAIATAKVLDVARADATSVRDAILRDWLGSQSKKSVKAAAPAASPSDLDSFASVVKELARANVEGRFGRHKVFIAPLWAQAREEGSLRRLSEAEFKARLVDAHRAGLLRLSRADLTPAMAPDVVAASEVPYLNAVFHFVDLEGALS